MFAWAEAGWHDTEAGDRLVTDRRGGGVLNLLDDLAVMDVEPRGIEPLTSCLQSRRSTN